MVITHYQNKGYGVELVMGKKNETISSLDRCSYCGEETEEIYNLSEVVEKVGFWSSFAGHKDCMKKLEGEV